MIEPHPSKIIYCYGEYQQLFRQYPQVTFHEGLPDMNDFDGSEPILLVVDDLMDQTNETIANLFTKGSHHRNVSVVFLVQNMFPRNKFARTISLNAHYMVLFKNPRDASQFANLARQMYPKRSQFAVEAYKDATHEPYSYLLVDLRPEQDEELRLRTNIFPGETHYVYVPKWVNVWESIYRCWNACAKWLIRQNVITFKNVTGSLYTVWANVQRM